MVFESFAVRLDCSTSLHLNTVSYYNDFAVPFDSTLNFSKRMTPSSISLADVLPSRLSSKQLCSRNVTHCAANCAVNPSCATALQPSSGAVRPIHEIRQKTNEKKPFNFWSSHLRPSFHLSHIFEAPADELEKISANVSHFHSFILKFY